MSDDTFVVIKSDTAVIPGWILYNKKLEHFDIRLWAVLNASDSTTQLSYAKIADFFGCVKRTIIRSISRLEEEGAVKVVRNQSKTNQYALWPFVVPGSVTEVTTGGVTEVTSDTEVTTQNDPTLYSLNKNVLSEKVPENFSQKYVRHQYPDEFNLLWAIYPRKTNKPGAYKKYLATIRSGVDHSVLLQAVTAYAASREGQEEKFTMHGSTFFGPDMRWQEYVNKNESQDEHDGDCAFIYDQWDADGMWVNPDTGEECFQNPSIAGYLRPQRSQNVFVASDGSLYSLNSAGERVSSSYWNGS